MATHSGYPKCLASSSLVPLFMWQTGLIRKPVFYISSFLESNREEYYERLLAVSRDGNWTGWCAFFLKALKAQAEDNFEKTMKILDLYGRMRRDSNKITRSPYAMKALDWIFSVPIFKATDFSENSGIPGATSRRILTSLREAKILKHLSEAMGPKASVLAFSDLFNIVEGRNVF